METAAFRGKPAPSSGTITGRSTEESCWTAAAGNGGSSTNVLELRDRYMLMSEPIPSPVTEARGECSVTSRNGASDGDMAGVVGDSEIRLRSRETRERLAHGEGANLVESELGWEGRSDVKRCNCGPVCVRF